MYKVPVYNEWHIRNLLVDEKIDFNKFYKDQLIDFLKVSTKDIKKYKELYRTELKEIDKLKSDIKILMNIISKNDIEITPEEDEVLEKYE